MSIHSVTIDVGGKPLHIETGRMARLAAGSAVVSYGETMVITGCSTSKPRPGISWFPLTIDYREKTYAAGKIPGGFLKRESAPRPKEILTMRMTDRPIRPLWPEGFMDEVQVQSFVISYDQQNDPDVLSVIGASAAVSLSKLPFLGPIGAVRVGLVNGEFVAFPDNDTMEQSDLDMVVAGTKTAVTMVEAGANEISEEVAIAALEFAHEIIKNIVAGIEELREKAGWTPTPYERPEVDESYVDVVREQFFDAYEEAVKSPTKLVRNDAKRAVSAAAKAALVATDDDAKAGLTSGQVGEALHKFEKEIVRGSALAGKRIDGRRPDEVRDITVEVGLLPRAHGSALFTRGETQALVTTTLGTGLDEKLVDGLSSQSFTKKYYLHYNFPPMCVGETRMIRGPSRREVGHGALAERSLLPVLPAMHEFPYTLRVVSDVLESNGSSSMASVCGNTLSMMDAGVKIRRPVAGIAMGLVDNGDQQVVLSDILGDEDHAGDMDFKVAGTQDGITALQMDIKMTGVTADLLARALDQAREGRIHILKEMLKTLPRPREDYNAHAPRVEVVKINPAKIGALIGPGGKNIRRIQEETGATVEVNDEGLVKIFATNAEAALRARSEVEGCTAEATLGRIYDGKVSSIRDFGAFIEILPGLDGLCHVSELANGYVGSVEDVVKMGEFHKVKVINIDESGRVKLSRRQALEELGEDASAPEQSGDGGGRPPQRPRDDGDRRGGRGGGDRDGGGGDRGGRGGNDRRPQRSR